MEAKKKAEAEKAMVEGAKCLKTSTFGRWKPDYEAAAAEYEKAATAFRLAKALPSAIEALTKASAMHEQFDSGYMAAKHVETAAFLAGAGGLKDPAKSADLYEKGAALHQVDGRLENASEALGKAARVLEGVDNKRAGEIGVAACDLFVDELADASELRTLSAIEAHKLVVPLLLRTGQPATAGAMLRRQAPIHVKVEQPHNVARCEFSAVVAYLSADDFSSAADGCDAALARGDGFAATDEAMTAEELLGAFTAQSEEALVACVAKPIFEFLDNQISITARKLTLRSAACPADRLMSNYTSNYSGAAAAASGGAASSAGASAAAGAGLGQGTGDFGEEAPEDDTTAALPDLTDDLT